MFFLFSRYTNIVYRKFRRGGGDIFSFLDEIQKEGDVHINRRGFLKIGAMAALLGVIPKSAFAAIPRKSKTAKAIPSKALHFFNPHTGEKLDVSYFAKGRYSPAAMKDISYLFRDHRTGAIKNIDPHLLDYLYGISLKLETRSSPFHIVS